jgi:hypothetical protein
MNLAELESLASARVEEATDLAARVLGFAPTPADLSAAVTGARPEELTELAAEWRRVVHKLDDHTGQLGDAAQRAFGGWRGEAADATADYVSDLVAALGQQRAATAELAEILEGLTAALERAAGDIEDASEQTGTAIIVAALVAVGAVTTLALTPGAQGLVPAAIAAGVEVVIVLVVAVIVFVTDRVEGISTLEDLAARRLDTLTGLGGADRLRALTTPHPPELIDVTAGFDHRRFYSAHMPADLRE